MTAAHATARLVDWQTALRVENKAPGTVAIYVDGATRYLRWCTDYDYLQMSRAALNAWIAGLLYAGAAPGTARIRQLAVRRFASWLTDGGEIPTDPFRGVKAPHVVPPVVEPLTDWAEDLAGIFIVAMIALAAVLAGWESIDKLINVRHRLLPRGSWPLPVCSASSATSSSPSTAPGSVDASAPPPLSPTACTRARIHLPGSRRRRTGCPTRLPVGGPHRGPPDHPLPSSSCCTAPVTTTDA